MTHATPLLQQLNALNVYQLNILQTLNFVFKLQQNLVPNTFHQLFTKRINKYSLRSDNYTEPRKKTKLTQFAISYRGPHLWNVILKDQVEIKKLTSPNSFKYKVKDLLLSIDLDNLLNFLKKKTLTKTRHCQVRAKRFSMPDVVACICNPAKRRLNGRTVRVRIPSGERLLSRWVPIFKRACNPI